MDAQAAIFGDKAEEFHLKEYEALRKEIDALREEQRALERYALIAIGAIWTWVYKDYNELNSHAWPLFIPCLFSALGAVRAYGINQTFKELGAYLRTLEKCFCKPGGPDGWEHFNNTYTKGKGTAESKGAAVFWSVLNIATVVVAVLGVYGLLKS